MSQKYWWSSGCGQLMLQLTMQEAAGASHQGQCDGDVLALSSQPHIREQLNALDPALLAEELKGYGAWSDADLADREQNLQRVLWLAAGDIVEGQGEPV